MNPWSILYYTAFVYYIYSGIFVFSLNKRAMVNRLFLAMCFTLSAWSLGYAFSTGAKTIEEAMVWRGVSTFGWTFFYSNLLLFIATVTHNQKAPDKWPWSFLLYVPSLIFFLRFLNHDTGNYVASSYGWVYLLYYKGPWSYTFDVFYLLCVVISFVLLFRWRKRTDSLREQKQVNIIIWSTMGAFLGGGLTDTLLPLFGVTILPMAILFSSIAIMGMWVAITKYKMMNLTQEIAAEHVLVTMKDPVIVLNPQYQVGQVNRATLELTDYTQSELVAKPAALIVPQIHEGHPIVTELNRIGYVNGTELEMISRNGSRIPCLCSGVNVMSDFGEKVGIILVLHDITSRKESEKLLKQVNAALKTKITKLNNVFDNVKEGIFTCKGDFRIQSEYSSECRRLFGGPIENKYLWDLFYPDNEEMARFTENLLKRIFEVDEDMRSLYMPLLPEVLSVSGLRITLHYRYTLDENNHPMLMVILTDTTEKLQLETQMEVERKTLKMVVKVMSQRDDFFELLEDYRRFEIEATGPNANLPDLKRWLHTLKGNFSQFDMLGLVGHLHSLETRIDTAGEHASEACRLIAMSPLAAWLQEDIQIIEATIGENFLKESRQLKVSVKQLEKIKELIIKTLPDQLAQPLLIAVDGLDAKPLQELLGGYPSFVLKLAERWQKSILPFKIEGDLVYVDPKRYGDLQRNLAHLFRNAIAHGIETEDERVELGKTPYGKIGCSIHEVSNGVEIWITDDGAGIDPQAVALKAIEKGYITREVLDELTEEEMLQLIFMDTFSMVTDATELCGRGVGLAATRSAVLALGGSIHVTSLQGEGTTFKIWLPNA